MLAALSVVSGAGLWHDMYIEKAECESMQRRVFVGGLAAGVGLATAGQAEGMVLTAQEALAGLEGGDLILIDIRTPREWQDTGVARGAWPMDMRDRRFGARLTGVLERNPDRRVAVICRTGNRSGYLVEVLARNGITNVWDVSEGMAGGPNGKGWIPSGLPIVTARAAQDAMPVDLRAD